MSDEIHPPPQPSGALVPPPAHPATALVGAASFPSRRADPVDVRRLVGKLVETTFDALDTLGDSIAGAVGLR